MFERMEAQVPIWMTDRPQCKERWDWALGNKLSKMDIAVNTQIQKLVNTCLSLTKSSLKSKMVLEINHKIIGNIPWVQIPGVVLNTSSILFHLILILAL